MEFTCPCCQKKVTEAHLSNTIELLKLNDCWHEVTPEQPLIFTLPHYKWACDTCLENKKAILADITKQNYVRRVVEAKRPFHLAYTPLKFVCRQCEKPFTISSAQQKRSYEHAKISIRSVPIICFGCQANEDISPEAKKLAHLKLTGEPMGKKRLMKLVATYKAMNDLENMQKYQSMIDAINAPKFEYLRNQIAELTQNGEPTDVRILIKLANYHQKLNEVETAHKYQMLIKKLQTEWWEANVKLKPKSVVEPKFEPKKTPINVTVKDTPVKKAKRKRIVKSFIEPQHSEAEIEPEPAEDGFFYGYWDE
jgi:hypothetical protein